MGRPAIFPDKTIRVIGMLTEPGQRAFEAARKRLAKLAKWHPSRVGDGDVMTALSIGWEATEKHLAVNPPALFQHGTASAYTNHGCRCLLCKAAIKAAQQSTAGGKKK